MPRAIRHIFAEYCYHFVNRATGHATVFHDTQDFAGFIRLMSDSQKRLEIPLLAYCLMPNHVHFVVRPRCATDLSRWAHWLFTTHSRRHHMKYGTDGHVWQGRFKTFPIQHDRHLLIVLRYVERNARGANLVRRAEQWRWGSLHWRGRADAPLALAASPVAIPSGWVDYVNTPQTSEELEALRTSSARHRPFGNPDWVVESARQHSTEQSLRSAGRPRKL